MTKKNYNQDDITITPDDDYECTVVKTAEGNELDVSLDVMGAFSEIQTVALIESVMKYAETFKKYTERTLKNFHILTRETRYYDLMVAKYENTIDGARLVIYDRDDIDRKNNRFSIPCEKVFINKELLIVCEVIREKFRNKRILGKPKMKFFMALAEGCQ